MERSRERDGGRDRRIVDKEWKEEIEIESDAEKGGERAWGD